MKKVKLLFIGIGICTGWHADEPARIHQFSHTACIRKIPSANFGAYGIWVWSLKARSGDLIENEL
jgi:hypothetical protein